LYLNLRLEHRLQSDAFGWPTWLATEYETNIELALHPIHHRRITRIVIECHTGRLIPRHSNSDSDFPILTHIKESDIHAQGIDSQTDLLNTFYIPD
jgi:hypothetical protein